MGWGREGEVGIQIMASSLPEVECLWLPALIAYRGTFPPRQSLLVVLANISIGVTATFLISVWADQSRL